MSVATDEKRHHAEHGEGEAPVEDEEEDDRPDEHQELVTSDVTPSVTSWSSASMSLVRRLTIQPVF